MEPDPALPLVDWAVASSAHPAHAESGDRHVVASFASGVLLAAVDGLGHGEEAAAAARAAVALLEAHRCDPLVSLVERCHAALLATRGAVMTLASLSAPDRTLSWIGVGNVEGVVLRADPAVAPARQALLLRGGVVGYHLPPLHASVVPVSHGDTLVLATDGIRSDFGWRMRAEGSPQRMADRVLADHAKQQDDALVLVARFLGGPA